MDLKAKIAAVRALLKQKTDEVNAHFAKDEKSTEHLTKGRTLTVELNALNDELDGLLEAQKAVARNAVDASANNDESGIGHNSRQYAQAGTKMSAEDKIGVAIGALLKAKNEPHKSAVAHMDEMGYGSIAKEFDRFGMSRKAAGLNASNAVAGGLLVPTDMSNDIIEILRPQTAFLQGLRYGMRRVPMPNGNYTMPAGATGASASYQQEGDPAAVTGHTFREVNLSAKTLTAVIPVTNDLLNFSIAGAQTFVQTDLRAAMAQKMDAALLRGDGTLGNPLGIMKTPGVTVIGDVNTNAPDYTHVDAYTRQLINALVNNYIPWAGAAWIFGKLLIGYLQDLRSSTGVPIYPGMQAAEGSKEFKGLPVIETTNIPVTLNTRAYNGGFNETEIALVAWPHVVFGEAMPLELAVSSDAAIEVGGKTISLFQRRMTAVLAVMQHDVGMRHFGAVAVGTGVTWGH